MRLLWNYVNKKQMAPASKRATFVSIWTLINAIIGGVLWFLIGRDFLPTIDWLICFAGYPAFFYFLPMFYRVRTIHFTLYGYYEFVAASMK